MKAGWRGSTGLALGVIGAGNATGTIKVTASSPGLTSSSATIPVSLIKDATKWCFGGPRW